MHFHFHLTRSLKVESSICIFVVVYPARTWFFYDFSFLTKIKSEVFVWHMHVLEVEYPVYLESVQDHSPLIWLLRTISIGPRVLQGNPAFGFWGCECSSVL